MDVARGGKFIEIPKKYPGQSWYGYDDETCDYECMAAEYIYWGIVSNMGILGRFQNKNVLSSMYWLSRKSHPTKKKIPFRNF